MRGYHAFTGCDTVSAFYSKGKTLTWKAWQQCIDATSAFKALSNPLNELTDDILISLEKFVIKLYCGDSEIVSVNEARKFLFTKIRLYRISPLQEMPLKFMHLEQPTKQVNIWGQAFDSSPDILSPSNWGWTEKEGQWQPIWTTQHSIWVVARELVKCGCKNSCRGRCSCRREGMTCTLLCKTCNGNCDNSSVIDREALIEDDIELDSEVLVDEGFLSLIIQPF
ncbi:unnamed protein product [Parnassius apollo]|uniref:(apollo) hypothetical protein n=1 Tax=Parnassius apollo TaxID=110799 RepID=A0A8S3WLE4_PARAO|nr:unnamed protein product [Parnassius apollo]